MAQPGNDNQKSGVSAGGPSNTFDGVVSTGDNFVPLGLSTRADGDPSDRGQTEHEGKWLYPDKPGID